MRKTGWDWLEKTLQSIRFDVNAGIIVLIGLPLVGKSTLARNAGTRFSLGHLSTGDWFRDQIAKETFLGKRVKGSVLTGDLLPTKFAQLAITRRLVEDTHTFKQGILFDGFPRDIEQAQLLEELVARFSLRINGVLHLRAPSTDLLIRSEIRRVCGNPQCKEAYGWALPPAKIAGVCNRCGHFLIRRPDDNLPIVHKRIIEGAPRDEKIAEYYNHKGLLTVVEASNNVELPDMLVAAMQELSRFLDKARTMD